MSLRMRSSSVLSVASRFLLLAVIVLGELILLEAGLRWHGGSETAPGFQSLFLQDPEVGYRLKPNASTRYTTADFSTDLAINAEGVRDEEPIGPKAAGERRILVLGDSLVLAVQVPFAETFGERLEARLNRVFQGEGPRIRVINGGVQGYGPVNEWFFFDRVAAAFEPDVVLLVVYVGNDAAEANDLEVWLLAGRPVAGEDRALGAVRRLVRRTSVLQRLRQRWDQLKGRFETPSPERPLASYLEEMPPFVEHGLDVTRRVVERMVVRSDAIGARMGLVLMPARFQLDDADYERLAAYAEHAGARLVRDAATERFRRALAPLGLPMLDLLPVLQRQPDRGSLFFQTNAHLTPRGHDVVAAALAEFVQSPALTPPAH